MELRPELSGGMMGVMVSRYQDVRISGYQDAEWLLISFWLTQDALLWFIEFSRDNSDCCSAAPLPCSDVRNFLRLIFYPIKVALLATLNHHYWWWENCDLQQTYFAAQQAVMGPGPGCKIPRHDDNLHSEVLLFLVQFVCGHNFFCRFCT